MKRGFTILELLVASLLLGMLMSILTMIFNQSSISWRVGEATIADLDDASDGITAVRYESDNLYTWGSESRALLSVWDENGDLRTRAIDAQGVGSVLDNEKIKKLTGLVTNKKDPGDWNSGGGGVAVASEKSLGGAAAYTVNVMSAGPNKQFNDYDDIWSFPDEFQ